MERNFKGGRNGTTAPSHLPLQGHAPPDSQLAVMTEVTPDCANDRIGACMGLHIDPERPRKLTCLCKVHVCPSTLRCLEQFSRPLEIFSRPEFDSSKAHFRPTPSNGAGFRATGRQKPRYTGC
jgi:hypothetical protein